MTDYFNEQKKDSENAEYVQKVGSLLPPLLAAVASPAVI
jgi:hypothetical protein